MKKYILTLTEPFDPAMEAALAAENVTVSYVSKLDEHLVFAKSPHPLHHIRQLAGVRDARAPMKYSFGV